jgi:hypothetical protein
MNAVVADSLVAPRARPARQAPDGLVHPDHPLVVHVHDATHSGVAGLPASALEALERVTVDGLLVEPRTSAVDVYARNEAAACAALEELRKMPRGLVDLLGPEVRYAPGPPPLEPVMTVEARMPALFGAFVRRELLRRRARMLASEPGRRSVTLRAEVPLARLLGFERWLAALTDRRGELTVALSRYAPLAHDHGPGGGPQAA